MKALLIVWKKELRELVRDRKTLMLSLLMGPILAPVLIIGLAKIGESKAQEQMEQKLEELLSKVQVQPAYQRLIAAQENFDKQMARVNDWILEGIEKGAASPIIMLG